MNIVFTKRTITLGQQFAFLGVSLLWTNKLMSSIYTQEHQLMYIYLDFKTALKEVTQGNKGRKPINKVPTDKSDICCTNDDYFTVIALGDLQESNLTCSWVFIIFLNQDTGVQGP